MSLVEKLVGEMKVKSEAQIFHDLWSGKPHHFANILPEKIQGCGLHEGEYGTSGSVLQWSYVHDGEAKKTKTIIELDNEKTIIVFKFVGGHFTEDYKDFHVALETIPNEETGGSLVRWTFKYERNNEKVPEPVSLLGYVMGHARDIDNHLQKAA